MIVCVTANPAIDKTIETRGFTVGATNRATREFSQVGGKGINFSAAASQLGLEVINCVYRHAEGGAALDGLSAEFGFENRFIPVEGRLRTNLKILDLDTNRITELNGRGEPVGRQAEKQMLDTVCSLLDKAELLVLTGSLPSGADSGYYALLAQEAAKRGVKCAVDASGEALAAAVEHKPYLIKPNYDEFCALVGQKPQELADICRAAQTLIARGVQNIVVSLGKKGALAIDSEQAFFAPELKVVVKGTTGAGDCMLAGICRALHEGGGLRELLASGTASATSSVTKEGTGGCTIAEYNLFKALVETVKISH